MTTLTVGSCSAIASAIARALDHEVFYRRRCAELFQVGHPVDESAAPEVETGVAENSLTRHPSHSPQQLAQPG